MAAPRSGRRTRTPHAERGRPLGRPRVVYTKLASIPASARGGTHEGCPYCASLTAPVACTSIARTDDPVPLTDTDAVDPAGMLKT